MLEWLLLMSASAPALPDITVTSGPKGFVTKVADFDARQQDLVDSEIDRRARSLCKENQVRWGVFTSQAALGKKPGTEPVMVRGYMREFSCVVPTAVSFEPAPADWKATTSDLEDAIGVFGRYYDKRDKGAFAEAIALLKPDLVSDPAKWSEEHASQNKKLGSGKRRVTGVTWYVNPDGAPHPGIYVAVDFVGDFPQAYFYCGYVVLFRRGSGAYEITREEQNMFTHGEGKPDSAQIEQMKGAMCRGQ